MNEKRSSDVDIIAFHTHGVNKQYKIHKINLNKKIIERVYVTRKSRIETSNTKLDVIVTCAVLHFSSYETSPTSQTIKPKQWRAQ